MRAWTVAVMACVTLAAGILLASWRHDQPFPHETHERLFPLCEGCHIGVVTGSTAQLFPDPASCAQCHDGEREPVVEWIPPDPRLSNLRFFHPDHADAVVAAGETAVCGDCHAAGDRPGRMAVAAAPPESCLGCHAHAAEAHLDAQVDCALCHVPLHDAPLLPTERLAMFPWPASHDEPDFLSAHGPPDQAGLFSCSVCHARETCERCHINADRVPQIAALEPDPRVAALEVGRSAEYPLPASHRDPGWGWLHGDVAAADPASCSSCHTQTSCTGCHTGESARTPAIAALPAPVPDGAQGVVLRRVADRVHPPDFDRRHGTWATAGTAQCMDCHSRQYCADCHAGADSRGFHPANFMERHALEVFAGTGDCRSCHNTQTFCQDCHVGVGVAADGRRDVAFHTAQPLWILAHGQAARIGMDSCVACHRQADCLACHSASSGWGVNPHGPGFDPGRVAARNRLTCRWCHLGDPIGGP